jgi:hypothetical protein
MEKINKGILKNALKRAWIKKSGRSQGGLSAFLY